MSGFSTFAIFGAGKLGSKILTALLEHPSAPSLTIRVLTRPGSSKPQVYVPSTVSFWPIDYSNPAIADAQLAAALRGVEVVISAVGSGLKCGEDAKAYAEAGKHIGDLPGFKSQRIVAYAAKKAGCQLFVPA
jgi:saccharopine dehydrogenase-like NADP-dependent oxidoreductase